MTIERFRFRDERDVENRLMRIESTRGRMCFGALKYDHSPIDIVKIQHTFHDTQTVAA